MVRGAARPSSPSGPSGRRGRSWPDGRPGRRHARVPSGEPSSPCPSSRRRSATRRSTRPGVSAGRWPPPTGRTTPRAHCSGRRRSSTRWPGSPPSRSAMTLMILGAVWGLLTGTRLLRGEEDAGALGAAPVGPDHAAPRHRPGPRRPGRRRGRPVGAHRGGPRRRSGTRRRWASRSASACFFALAEVATAAMFAGVGAVTSQLAATRRQAAAWAATLLGVGLRRPDGGGRRCGAARAGVGVAPRLGGGTRCRSPARARWRWSPSRS